MLKKSFLLILVAIIILSSKPFAFELNTDNLNNNNNLFNRFIINKESYNSEVTQIEFVVLMGRLLSLTDDLAKNKIIQSSKNIPKWAEKEVTYTQNKFGALTPYYFKDISPKEKLTKETVTKMITAYLEPNKEIIEKNSKIDFNPSFYNFNNSYQELIDYNILPNNSRNTLTKSEIVTALLNASELRKLKFKKEEDKIIEKNEDIDLTANVGMGNLYIWRGMNQADAGISNLYGGLDINVNENISFGTWSSNVSFTDSTSYEWDIYASYTNEFRFIPGFNYEIGYIYYAYPDSLSENSIDFSESYFGIMNDELSMRFYYLITGPNNALSGDDTYFNINYNRDLIKGFSLIMGVGFYNGSSIISGSQTDYIFGISKNGFTFATTGTDNEAYTQKIQIQYQISLI